MRDKEEKKGGKNKKIKRVKVKNKKSRRKNKGTSERENKRNLRLTGKRKVYVLIDEKKNYKRRQREKGSKRKGIA